MNGFWLLFLLGRWSMVHGWIDLFTPAAQLNNKREFVSVDARMDDLKKDTRSYEMLSRDASSSAPEAGGPRTTITATTSSSILKKEHDPVTSFASSPTGASSRAMPNSAMTANRSPSALSHQTPGFERVTPLSPVAHAKSGFDYDEAHDAPSPLMDLSTAAMGGAGAMNTAAGHSRYGSHSSSFTYNNNTTTISAGGAPAAATVNSAVPSGRRTPDYFGQTARYHAPARSFSNPRPPTASSVNSPPGTSGRWDSRDSFARAASPPHSGTGVRTHSRFGSRNDSRTRNATGGDDDYDNIENRHPLGMNRI